MSVKKRVVQWDYNGHWIVGFGMFIGVCSITIAELWGLYQGLILAWKRGIRALQVKVDSMCVVHLLQRTDGHYNAASPLVYGILELLSRR